MNSLVPVAVNAISFEKKGRVFLRDATGLRFSEFLQKYESFGVYNVNIADFTQISEYFCFFLKLFHVMRQTCFLSE